MGVVDGIRGYLVTIHRKIERFSDDRIGEASFNKLIWVMLFIGFSGGVFAALMSYDYNLGNVFAALMSSPQSIAFVFLEYFILLNIWFAIQAFLVAVSARIVRKLNGSNTKMLQPKLLQVVYSYMAVIGIALFVALLMTVFGSIFSSPPGHSSTPLGISLQLIADAIGIFFVYALLVLWLRLFRPSIVEYVEFAIAGFVMAIALIIVIDIVVLAFGLLVYVTQNYVRVGL